jgi:vacuolar-type H+-ATPase subunit F/Vma7
MRLIADQEIAALFGAVGFDARAVKTDQDAREAVAEARAEEVPFLVVTEAVRASARDVLDDSSGTGPLAYGVLPDPSDTGRGDAELADLAIRATGSDRIARGLDQGV